MVTNFQNDKIMSTLALHLIAENKKTKATRLELGNCGLTELPQYFDCTHLASI